MINRAIKIGLSGLFTALILSACSDSTYLAEGGIGGTGISSGPISGFGSIYVNGIRFDTRDAQITLNGNSATEDALQLGMVVTVVGEINSELTQGTADTITFNYLLQAEVSSVDPQGNTIVAAGKTISVDELTVFINTALTDLKAGDNINISGNKKANGDIAASYIAATEAEIPTSSPIGGDTGFLQEQFSNTREKLDTESLVVSGLITSFPTESRIVVQGIAVDLDADTSITNGTQSDLDIDSGVEIKARIKKDGALVAEKITIHRRANIHIEAAIDSIDANNASLTLAGITMSINATTLMQDSSSANVRRFSLRDLGIGDTLVVYGRKEGPNIVLTRLQRRDDIPATMLSGPIDNPVSDQTFELLGLTVDTSNAEISYTDANGNSISANDFFIQLSDGAQVQASGTLNSSTLIADDLVIKGQ